MAVPVITNSSPAPGNIAWTSFIIQYNGVGYAVSAGSTNQRWVWWRYNGGVSSVIEAGATIPTDLTFDDLVLFKNISGIGSLIQQRGLIDGEQIVGNSISESAIKSRILGPYRWGSDLRPMNHGEYVATNAVNVPTATWSKRVSWAEVNNTLSPLQGIGFGSNSWTIGVRGLYLFTGMVTLAAAGAGVRRVRLFKNATTTVYLFDHPTATGALKAASLPINCTLVLDAGDVIEVYAYHDVGSNVPWVGVAEQNMLSITCLGTLP